MRHAARQFLERAREVTAVPLGGADELLVPAPETAEESQRQLSALIADLPVVAYRCSVHAPWELTFVSAGVELMTGYSAAEVMTPGFTWAGIMHPDDVEMTEQEVAARLSSREMFSLEYRIIDRAGRTRWVSERGRATYSLDGDALFLEGFISDITDHKSAEAEATAKSQRLRATLDSVPQMLWSVAPDGSTDYYRNKQWYDFTGWEGERSSFSELKVLIHPDDVDRVAGAWAQSLATGAPYQADYRLRHHSGEFRWVSSTGILERDAQGKPVHWYGTSSDVHDRVLAEHTAETSEALTRGIVEATPDCLSLLDLNGTVLLVNQATIDCYGLADGSQLIGSPWGHRLALEYKRTVATLLSKARGGESGRATVHITTPAGVTRWWDMVVAPVKDSGGNLVRVAVTSRDITDQKRAEGEAVWAATHDALTELPNRLLLERKLDGAIKTARLTGSRFGFLILDIDHFKRINDSLGHDAGDSLLCSFAHRLRENVAPSNFVARLAGDEFAVLLRDVDNEEDLTAAIERILNAVAQPFEYNGRLLDTGASIGTSMYPDQGSTRSTLLKNADMALYSAKKAGRGTWRLFTPRMRSEIEQRSAMLSLARQALTQRCIVPYYQAKTEMGSGKAVGYEALLRWRHPRKGIQACGAISAALEDLKLAREISDEILAAVVCDIQRWRQLDVPFEHVAVNAAAADFRDGDFAERLLERLARASIPTSCLQVEVTETVFLGRGAECVESALKTLSTAGIKIALDDFGTGYASLSHLKQFPVETIKIDQSFVRDLKDDPEDAAIIDAVVNLARSLGMSVIAEGVETVSQQEALQRLGCRLGQGFLYGKPKSAQHLEEEWKKLVRADTE